MMVLDTHVLLWWAAGDTASLSPAASLAIESEIQKQGQLLVSAISAWEIAMLVARGRIGLTLDVQQWLATVRQVEAVQFVPIDTDIAVHSAALPGEFHKDPADRMIVATARKFACPLVTADEKIRAYPHVRTVW